MSAGEYLLLVLEDERAHLAQAPGEMHALLRAQGEFARELRERGALREHGRLRPSAEGRRVRGADRAPVVDRGPFDDEGRALGLYYWVRAGSLEEAVDLGASCPMLPDDALDVRPVSKGAGDDRKPTMPGKIFAFVVLGSAPSSEAWGEVMDRIDAETVGRFPAGAFAGGVRLRAPEAGRKLATRGGRRAAIDGPFIEGKEIVGGLFFLRMSALDDAVAWAAQSRFVAHGTLDVRELWRS